MLNFHPYRYVDSGEKAPPTPNFEQAMKRLDEIVELMESPNAFGRFDRPLRRRDEAGQDLPGTPCGRGETN